MAKKKQFAVFGLGRFGSHVALTLEDMGFEVLGVDRNETVAASMAERLTRVVSFDIRNERTLREAGIADFDTVVIASKDLEASLMATMLCKEFGVAEIIVKAIDERHAKMAYNLGASKVIFSERDTARRVAMNLVSDNTVDYIDIDANVNMLRLSVPKNFVGKSLNDTNLRVTYKVNVIAVISNGQTIVTPPPEHIFAAEDIIFVIGTPAALSNFERDTIA